MNVTIVDYNSGNISSVVNSFKEVTKNKINLKVTSDLQEIRSSDKLVLPGQGSFKSCVDALNAIDGLSETLNEFVINDKKPLLGICVGLQMFADIGYEETETKGLGWISGKVSKIDNQSGKFKLPHIGWNQINIVKDSKIYKDIENILTCILCIVMNFCQMIKMLFQQQLIIHQILFVLLKKKIFLERNFTQKKVIRLV